MAIEPLNGWTRRPLNAVASNGATPVSLVAAVPGHSVVPVKLIISVGTAASTVALLSGATPIFYAPIPASTSFVLDNDFGNIRTDNGDALQVSIVSGGDVTVSGLCFQ